MTVNNRWWCKVTTRANFKVDFLINSQIYHLHKIELSNSRNTKLSNETKLGVLYPNLLSKISYEQTLKNVQNEAVSWNCVLRKRLISLTKCTALITKTTTEFWNNSPYFINSPDKCVFHLLRDSSIFARQSCATDLRSFNSRTVVTDNSNFM